jgi:hypothetical protein
VNKKEVKSKCVFLMKRNGKPYRYMVRTYIDKERRYIGCFKTEQEAIIAYNKFMTKQLERKLELLKESF